MCTTFWMTTRPAWQIQSPANVKRYATHDALLSSMIASRTDFVVCEEEVRAEQCRCSQQSFACCLLYNFYCTTGQLWIPVFWASKLRNIENLIDSRFLSRISIDCMVIRCGWLKMVQMVRTLVKNSFRFLTLISIILNFKIFNDVT